MRHRWHKSKLGRPTGHRRALLRNLAIVLINEERIRTTVAKAKELRRLVEKLVTWGKEGSLPSRRLAFTYLQNKGAVHKLFQDISPRFKDRPGGYTRVVRDSNRAGDGAEMAFIEFVERVEKEIKPKKKKKERAFVPRF